MRRSRSIPPLVLSVLATLALLAATPESVSAADAERSTAEAEVAVAYGVRACNHGDYAAAVRLFEEALAADPKSREAREWLAFARRRLAIALQPGGTVAPSGFDGLLAVRDQPRFDLRLGAAYGSDSNPALLPDDVVASGASIPTLRGEADDRTTGLDLRAAVYPFYGRGGSGGWSMGLVGQVKVARFQDFGFLDRRQWSAAASLAWGSDPLGYLTGPLGYTRVPFGHGRAAFLLQAGRTDTRLDGNPLATVDEAALSAVFREAVWTATQVELDLQRRDLVDGRAEPDLWSAGASQLFFLGRRDRYLRLGAQHGEETDGLDGDVTSLEATAELALPLRSGWTLQIAAARRQDEIERPIVRFDETTTRAVAALTWGLTHHLYLTGRVAWSRRESDLAPASPNPLDHRDYRRKVASLGLQWLW